MFLVAAFGEFDLKVIFHDLVYDNMGRNYIRNDVIFCGTKLTNIRMDCHIYCTY